MKKNLIVILFFTVLFSCTSNKPNSKGTVDEIWICPHAGIGSFSHIYIYLEIDDTLFFNNVIQNKIDRIGVNNIAGFDYSSAKIIDVEINTLDTNKRFMLWIQTHLNVVDKILESNKIIDTIYFDSYMYRIDGNNTSVHLGSKELSWDFEAPPTPSNLKPL